MQPLRRSTHVKQTKEAGESSQAAATLASLRSRKRSRRPSPVPVAEPTDPEVESLDSSNDDDSRGDNSGGEDSNSDSDDFLPKIPRYEASRQAFQDFFRERHELLHPQTKPMTRKLLNLAASTRYQALRRCKFLIQHSLPLTYEKLRDVKRIMVKASSIYTVIDTDPFIMNAVREFIANIVDAEERGDGLAVYVRGSLVDFSPSLINSMYCIPGFEEEPQWRDKNIDSVYAFLTNNRVRCWENISSKFLTTTNQVLYKLVCSNWIPTTSYTAMNQERLKTVYMLHHYRGFDFGKLIYDQILKMARNTAQDTAKRIIFPTPIQQVLFIQRVVPPDTSDEEITSLPKPIIKDNKAGRGSGADSSSPCLAHDIDRLLTGLKTIRMRLRRGNYGNTVVHQESEEDDDEESASASF